MEQPITEQDHRGAQNGRSQAKRSGDQQKPRQRVGRRCLRMVVQNKLLLLCLLGITLLAMEGFLLATRIYLNTPRQDLEAVPQKWGSLVRGRCGKLFPLSTGAPSACDPRAATCCSPRGWCSSSPEDCLCEECAYYEWQEFQKYLPANIPLVDDNSDFMLGGYKNFLLEPKINCNSNILIVVYSAINNFAYRQMIRMTWGNERYLEQINASLFFVVGRYPSLKIQFTLEQESRRHNDILQADFYEDYFLLAFKSLAWMDWSRSLCAGIPWMVKTDDDMVNNVWKLGALVEALKSQTNTITCSTKTEQVIREKSGGREDKWVIPFDEWPGEFFPTNCWGVVYIMSSLVRDKLLQVYESSDGGIFRVDDVFITGMLAERANVTHRDISDIITFYEDWDEEVLLTGNVWFGHVPPDHEMLQKKRFWLWRRMLEHEFPHTWQLHTVDLAKFRLN